MPGYLNLPGSNGNRAVTDPDTDFNLHDLDIRVLAWIGTTPAYSYVIGAEAPAPLGGIAWNLFSSDSPNELDFEWFDPVDYYAAYSALGIVALGAWRWYRVTLDVDNGSSQHVVSFYYSDDGLLTVPGSVSWTLHDQQTIAGTAIIDWASDVAAATIGDPQNLNAPLEGRVGYAEIRDAVGGTIVANPDFRTTVQQDSASQLTDDTGKVWTVEPPAEWVLNPPAAYLNLTGAVGSRASTPYVALVPAGIDIALAFRADNISNFPILFSGFTGGSTNSPSYEVYADTVGLYLGWGQVGPTYKDATSTADTITTGVDYLRRVTLEFDDGGGNYRVRFYTSADPIGTPLGSVTWTLLETINGVGTTTIITSSPLSVGTWLGHDSADTYMFDGRIYAVEAKDGIGGAVLWNPDFRTDAQRDSSTQLTDDQGHVWTVESPAAWLFFETGTIAAVQAAQVGALSGTVTNPPPVTATFASTQAAQVFAMAGHVTNPVIPPVPGSGGSRMGGTGAIRKPPRG